MRYLAIVSYLGTHYQGWQKQPDTKTVQETIELAISKLFNTQITIYGSGRTDADVHANGQTFHFDVDNRYSCSELMYRINCILPEDINILKIKKVNNEFHARYNAIGKNYYYLVNNVKKDALLFDKTYLFKDRIDLDLLKEASKLFIGEHDFKDFTSKEEDEQKFIRIIDSITITKTKNIIKIDFVGNGFMKYEIRFIVGALLAVASGKEKMEYISYHLQSNKNREIINYKAPGMGLYLNKVIY